MINENTPLLQTERLILRKFTPNDIPPLFELLSDEDVNTFLPWFPVKTPEETAVFLQQRFLSYYDKPSAYRYAVCLKETNIPIGYVWLSGTESNDFGYALKKEYWHTGITTEASLAAVGRIREAGYPFITATHDIHNPHSGDVMKKIGMHYRYSYVEQWQPKNFPVTFRMYQLNFDQDRDRTYMKYWEQYPHHFIEADIK